MTDDATPRGWYPSGEVGLRRWWNGAAWEPIGIADDGHVDVRERIGQEVISLTVLGGITETAVARLMDKLSTYPPCRIESIETRESGAAPGVELLAVISWSA